MRRCVLCGSTHNVRSHHVGGRNFIGWFTMLLCDTCHGIFHTRQRQAGIDLRCTPDRRKMLVSALKMTDLFNWMLIEKLEKEIHENNKTIAN
jgi:hypothetical protein